MLHPVEAELQGRAGPGLCRCSPRAGRSGRREEWAEPQKRRPRRASVARVPRDGTGGQDLKASRLERAPGPCDREGPRRGRTCDSARNWQVAAGSRLLLHSTSSRLAAAATSRRLLPRATCRHCSSTSDAWARYRRASAILLCRCETRARAGSVGWEHGAGEAGALAFRSEPFLLCSSGAALEAGRSQWSPSSSPSSWMVSRHLRLLGSAPACGQRTSHQPARQRRRGCLSRPGIAAVPLGGPRTGPRAWRLAGAARVGPISPSNCLPRAAGQSGLSGPGTHVPQGPGDKGKNEALWDLDGPVCRTGHRGGVLQTPRGPPGASGPGEFGFSGSRHKRQPQEEHPPAGLW